MFCKKCGTEMKDEWKVCPSCEFSIKHDEIAALPEDKSVQKQEKPKKSIFTRRWFWIVIVLLVIVGFTLLDGNDDSKEGEMSKSQIVAEAEKTEVKTLEEVGGFVSWEDEEYPGRVRMDIVVSLPVTPKDDDSYLVQVQTSFGGIVAVTQEDDTPVQEWGWLMNAQPLAEGDNTVVMSATLIHCGGLIIDDTVYPRFIITDIENH